MPTPLEQRRARASASLQSAMALHAGVAAVIPTTTARPTASTAPMADARRPDTRDSGSPLPTPTLGRIPSGKGTVGQLAEWAQVYPEPMRAGLFVRLAFERPYPPKLRAPSEESKGGLHDGGLRFWSVLSLANEWDEEGLTTPAEFVEALSCEVEGHPRGDAVSSVLRDVGRESEQFSQVESEPDEYQKWRHGG